MNGDVAFPDFFFIFLWTLELAVNHKNKSMNFANSIKMKVSYWFVLYEEIHTLFQTMTKQGLNQSILKLINGYLHIFIDLIHNFIYTVKIMLMFTK